MVAPQEHRLIPTGTGPLVALGYPAPYAVGASSLGFQSVYRMLAAAGLRCERFFFDGPPGRTIESGADVRSASLVAFSTACEQDLAAVAAMLWAAGMAPLAKARTERDPAVVIGGSLTRLDPELVAPFADVVVVGDGETAVPVLAEAVRDQADKAALMALAHGRRDTGMYAPDRDGPCAERPAGAEFLPAVGAWWSPAAELADMFLVEVARGCPHRCAFCLLATDTYRAVPVERIVSAVPEEAEKVGLVGAAVTNHPRLEEIVRWLVDRGHRVSLSSIRADRLTPSLLHHLVRGGLHTVTVAADGSSQAVRDGVRKRIDEEDLLRAAALAKEAGVRRLKIYSMVGLPGETDGDVDEFVRLMRTLGSGMALTVAVQSFVPKPRTPLAHVPMAPLNVLKRRLRRIERGLAPRGIAVQPSSVRWSWVDWKIAHGGRRSALAAVDAAHHGADFAAWRRAIAAHLDGD